MLLDINVIFKMQSTKTLNMLSSSIPL